MEGDVWACIQRVCAPNLTVCTLSLDECSSEPPQASGSGTKTSTWPHCPQHTSPEYFLETWSFCSVLPVEAPLPHRASAAEGYAPPSSNRDPIPTHATDTTPTTPGTNFNSTTPCLTLHQITCSELSRIASWGPGTACPVAFRSTRPCCLATSTWNLELALVDGLFRLNPLCPHCHHNTPPPPLLHSLALTVTARSPPAASKHRFQYFSPPLPPDTYGRHKPRDPRVEWVFHMHTPSAQLLCSLYSPLLFLSFPLLYFSRDMMCFFLQTKK